MTVSASIRQFPEQRDEEVIGYGHSAVLKTPPPYTVPVVLVSTVEVRAKVPDEMLIGSLRDGRLQVHTPIAVKLSTERDHFVAQAQEFNEFGFGTNPSEALRDLQRALTELYFTLEQEQHRLGPDLAAVWAKLQQAIRRRP